MVLLKELLWLAQWKELIGACEGVAVLVGASDGAAVVGGGCAGAPVVGTCDGAIAKKGTEVVGAIVSLFVDAMVWRGLALVGATEGIGDFILSAVGLVLGRLV